jgi:hypothetical protein
MKKLISIVLLVPCRAFALSIFAFKNRLSMIVR